jgi:hypothetical protein
MIAFRPLAGYTAAAATHGGHFARRNIRSRVVEVMLRYDRKSAETGQRLSEGVRACRPGIPLEFNLRILANI